MKASVDERKAVTVNQLQLHVDLVVFHFAIEGQLVPRCALELQMARPILVFELFQSDGLVLGVDLGNVPRERIVHVLQRRLCGSFKYNAAPAVAIS